MPLAQLDSTKVVLQRDDLPSEYVLTNSESDGAEVFTHLSDVHNGLVKFQSVYYTSVNGSNFRGILNWVMAYSTEAQAQKSFRAIKLQLGGDDVDVPRIGAEAHGNNEKISMEGIGVDVYVTMVMWRDGAFVAAVLADSNGGKTSLSSIVDLARIVQARLVDG